jgi:hypothetical protein
VQWPNVFVNLFIHLGFFVGFYYLITMQLKLKTYIYCKSLLFACENFFLLIKFSIVVLITCLCNLSVTIGVHRLWSHRSFKCNRLLKLILMVFYTLAGQVVIFHFAILSNITVTFELARCSFIHSYHFTIQIIRLISNNFLFSFYRHPSFTGFKFIAFITSSRRLSKIHWMLSEASSSLTVFTSIVLQ